jgi:hypothetical protein
MKISIFQVIKQFGLDSHIRGLNFDLAPIGGSCMAHLVFLTVFNVVMFFIDMLATRIG